MKRMFLVFLLVFVGGRANSQGYIGAVLSLSKIGYDCPAGATCDHSGRGLKIYGGIKIPEKNVFDFGIGRIDGFDVSYMSFKEINSPGASQQVGYLDELGEIAYRTAPTKLKVQADAVTAAMAARFPIFDQLSMVARFGGAFVSSTYRTDLDGRTNTSVTSTKLKPYLGLGLEYEIPNILKIVGGVDMTKYDVDGKSGNLRMIGLGAQTAF